MGHYLTAETSIVIDDLSRGTNAVAKAGDVLVFNAEDIPRIRSAIVSDIVSPYNVTRFYRRFYDSRDGRSMGFLFAHTPVPDPNTLFARSGKDPLLAGAPQGLREQVDPVSLIPAPTDGCVSRKCVQIIPSIDIFYSSPEPTNTACLSAITSPAPTPTGTPKNFQPAFVLAIVQPYTIYDTCRNWLFSQEGPRTLQVASSLISSLHYRPDATPVPKPVDFADLPCPPSDITDFFDHRAPYSPILLPLSKMNVHDGVTGAATYGECDSSAVIDPPVRAIRVGEITETNDNGDTIV
ncbi:MAG: hypothetical protein Q9222_003925 [Ikaeria aurantiellina]